MKAKEYQNYESFIDGVADAVYKSEMGEHYLLEDFTFGFERKHIAYVGSSKMHYQVFDKEPFLAWVDVTSDYLHDFEIEIENKVNHLIEVEDEDPRDCIGYNKEEYLGM
jgi:hypothetical protein